MYKMIVLAVVATGMTLGAVRADEMSTSARQTYLVISPHTPEQCLAALDHLVAERQLSKFEFGCKHGDHTGYARVEAASPEEALAIVPASERANARAIPLDRFTPEQIRALHHK